MKRLFNLSLGGALFLLTACGGGSDSAGSAPTTLPGNNLPPLLIVATEQQDFAGIALNSPEGMLQIGHYADSLVLGQTVQSGRFQLCSNGGGRTVNINTALPLAQNTVITDILDDCYVEALDAVLQGEVTITVASIQQSASNETLVLDVNLTKAVIKDTQKLTILDPIKVSLTHQPLSKQIQIEPRQSQVRFDFSDGERFTINQFSLTSLIDLTTAKYSIQFQGRLGFNKFGRDLAFRTVQPLAGYIGEYPHQGRVELSDSQNNLLVISANQVVNSETATVKFNTAEAALYHWSGLTDGAYWKWPGMTGDSGVRQFRHDNFELLGMIGKTKLTDFPTQGRLSYLFSRPVKSISPNSLQYFFGNTVWDIETIGANVSIEGAVVHVTPIKSLVPGAFYRLGRLEAVNTLDISTTVNTGPVITVSNAVKALISKNHVSFSTTSSPTISAEKSSIRNPQGATYQWQEVSALGVVFANPKAATTTFSVPKPAANQQVKIRLTVVDAAGYSHSDEATFFYHDANLPVFYYESDKGDGIGQGQTRFYTPTQGRLSTNSEAKSKLTVNFEGQEQQRSVWWYMTFVAANDQDLVPGRYENATRAPFQPKSGNGINIDGNGRGCNTVKGSFEIFEIEFTEIVHAEGFKTFNVAKLALNFTQHCGNDEPAMRGKIRINSNYPL